MRRALWIPWADEPSYTCRCGVRLYDSEREQHEADACEVAAAEREQDAADRDEGDDHIDDSIAPPAPAAVAQTEAK